MPYRYRADVSGDDPLPNEHNICDTREPTIAYLGFIRPNVGAIPPMSELQVMWWIRRLQGAIPGPRVSLKDCSPSPSPLFAGVGWCVCLCLCVCLCGGENPPYPVLSLSPARAHYLRVFLRHHGRRHSHACMHATPHGCPIDAAAASWPADFVGALIRMCPSSTPRSVGTLSLLFIGRADLPPARQPLPADQPV